MPTRKEILENLQYEIERLTDVEQNNIDALQQVADKHTEALQKHGDAQIEASQTIERAIKSFDSGIEGGVFMLLFGGLIAALYKRVKEINKKTDLIKSILKLQEKNECLSYNFIIERSFAEGSTKEERQNIINELIYDGIITEYKKEGVEAVRIDKNSSELKSYWDWLDNFQSEAKNTLAKNKS